MKRAIAYFSNGFGNFVLMMPYLAGMATMTDSGKIDICLDGNWNDSRKPAVLDTCKAWPVIDRIFDWPHSRFNEREYGLWFFSAHGNNGCGAVSIFLAHLTRETLRIRPSWRSTGLHEQDHYWDVLESLGFKGNIPKVRFPMDAGPNISTLPHPRIGLCNGWFRSQRDWWTKKGWPHFTSFSRLASDFFGGSMIGLGLRDELPKEARLDEDYTGKLGMLGTAKVISQLDLLVTTDSGLMHVANIMGIPLIALFGPTLISKNKPRAEASTVLKSSVNCAPCQDLESFDTCKDYRCMASITPADVLAVAMEKLKGGGIG